MSPVTIYTFGPFELDAGARRLTKDGEVVALTDRQVTLLLHLVANPGIVVSKGDLIDVAWGDVAVADNSLEQQISGLRRLLTADPEPYVQTVPRRGYRFSGKVTRVIHRETDEVLDALLAPHRAWMEGRAALETLDRDRIAGARLAFEEALVQVPGQASAHVGLANACVMQFETTRATATPDTQALALAAEHAREACRLDPAYGEAWATLGFVLERTGRHVDALAASRRAVMLEPDNWRHHLRLASVGWGEERLRAARRTLALLPGFPLAHWLAATVHVARLAFDEARRELDAGILAARSAVPGEVRCSGVALHWTLGLLHAAESRATDAVEELEREVTLETTGHLYARECAASALYAIGALRLRAGDVAGAKAALDAAIERMPLHPLAIVARRLAEGPHAPDSAPIGLAGLSPASVEAAMVMAARLAHQGRHVEAAAVVHEALAAAAAGPAGWGLPVEPLLGITLNPAPWAAVLGRLRTRAM